MAQIKFHYVKSAAYSEIPVHGVWGGVTPQGTLSIAVFSERAPVPQELVFEVNPDGTLGAEVRDKRVSKEDYVRVIDAVLYMDLAVATSFRNWLSEKIEEAQKLQVLPEAGK